MFTPRTFAETDLAGLDWLATRDAFATIVTAGADGLPCANHLPVLYRRNGDRVLLEGHWSRANPQAKQAGPALVILHGPHHYISPGWYPDKATEVRVPTWNYAVAHLYGELRTYDDTAGLSDLIARLSDHYEASIGGDWRFDTAREEEVSQLRGIIGFRFEVSRVELKFKLNQNHPAANVHGAAESLRALGRPGADEVAALMLDRLARRETIEA